VQTRASCSIYSYVAMRKSILTAQGDFAASACADSNSRGHVGSRDMLAYVPVLHDLYHEPAQTM